MSGRPLRPAVTVVIPTYNWSAALRCAIRSVLLQTVGDFEILVVGDGCTDDSDRVVKAFQDKRIRWHNLDRNYGSQWAANNYAIENAESDWIAYLGHDDIWYPTHLEAILRTAKTGSADVVASVMVLYGPPGSNVRGIAGLFGSGTYSPKDFVPPSAFAHTKALYGDAIKWRDPATVTLPMDALFVNQVAASARKFAATGELTSFKFNAAWRRDAYKLKPVDEQLAMLQRIESKVDFRQSELIDILQSVVSGRFLSVQNPPTQGVEPGWFVRQNRKFKGIDSRFQGTDLKQITGLVRFDLTGSMMPFEWHDVERDPAHGSFRWSGPSRESTIDLPIVFNSDLLIRLKLLNSLVPADTIALEIHGRRLTPRIRVESDSTVTLEADVRIAELGTSPNRDFGVTIKLDQTIRPGDVSASHDFRWVGVAVNWIELEPLAHYRSRIMPEAPPALKRGPWTIAS